MLHKLKVIDVENACQCPFYMQSTDGQSSCVIKLTTTPEALTSHLESDTHSDFDYWDMDCGGEWANCSILPLLYQFKEEEEEEETQKLVSTNEQAIDEYNPFGDSENPDDYPDEIEAPVIVPAPDTLLKKNVEMEIFNTKFTIHVVKNPYLVKGDILVYPTNNQLYIDDIELRKMLRGSIDSELEAYLQKPIKMGQIYTTSNGGSNSHVKAKKIYHAIVAGTSRLVNEKDVGDSTFKALARASNEGVESIILIPSDCGTLDIYATALVQIGAIKQFLMSHKDTSIKHIFMVMTDNTSYEVFVKYHKRIFRKRKTSIKQ